ncbi:MAG: ArnT family glycosyltransferase [Solirubrobacteraceae bacterium]
MAPGAETPAHVPGARQPSGPGSGDRSGSADGAFRLGLGVVALAALGIRLFYILVIARAPVGIGGDAGFYDSSANLIAAGHFYFREILGHVYPTAEHPPLYSLVLSAGALLGAKTLIAARVISCAIGTVTVTVIGLLGRRLAGTRAGLAGALAAALWPPLITADGLVMSEPLFALLVACAVLVSLGLEQSLRRSRRGRSRVEWTRRSHLLPVGWLGILIGLATLTRGEGLLLAPLLGWPLAWRLGPRPALRELVLTAAMLAVVGPWVVRNIVVFHRPLLAADANTVIAGANCPDAYYGHDIGWWSLGCLERARTPYQLHVGDAATSAALRYAGDHLGRLPLVALARVARSFDLLEPMRQGNHEPRRHWFDELGLFLYYPMMILAGFGLAALGRGRRWLVLAPVWMVLLTSVLGWGIGRFRIGADVVALALAGLALARLTRGQAPWRASRETTTAASAIR